MGPMCFPRPLCRECWRLDPKGRAPMAAAAGACLRAGAACRPASPSWSSPAGCIFQASCQATEVVIAHLQPQMGNVERLHCEARDSWRMASPQASSNARGPDVRMCVSKAADCSGKLTVWCAGFKGSPGLEPAAPRTCAKSCSFTAWQRKKKVLKTVCWEQDYEVAFCNACFFMSKPRVHLCLSGDFIKMKELKGALLFHWHVEKHFPHHHCTSTELTSETCTWVNTALQ